MPELDEHSTGGVILIIGSNSEVLVAAFEATETPTKVSGKRARVSNTPDGP